MTETKEKPKQRTRKPQTVDRKLELEKQALTIMLADLKDIVSDDPEAKQMVLESETSLPEIIESTIELIFEDESMVAVLKARMGNMQNRINRFEKRKMNRKTAIQNCMNIAEMKSLELPIATVTIKATPAKLIVNEEMDIPSEYFAPGKPKLDRKQLTVDLKEGKAIPGVVLSNGGETIQIRGQ